MTLILLIPLAIIVFAVIFVIGLYNKLVQLRNRVKNAFSQIDVQLKRRYDLIPNLVETAKGYLKHERETLDAVVSARGAAVSGLKAAQADPTNADAIGKLGAADAQLTGALGRLMVVVEAYPDLKANQNMMQLSEELTSTENKVSFARQAYNDSVLGYNNACEQFPSNVVARWFNFAKSAFFEVDAPAEREAPKVSF